MKRRNAGRLTLGPTWSRLAVLAMVGCLGLSFAGFPQTVAQVDNPFEMDGAEKPDENDENLDLATELQLDFDEALRSFQKGGLKAIDWKTASMLLAALVLAVLLAMAIAYHPSSFGRASTLEEFEAPKTYLIYALVGAVCGRLVVIEPRVALVIFGLGGLMRFRTDVGAAKDTGRVILVTLVGLCCGLDAFLVAIYATAFGVVLIFFIERGVAYRVTIKGLPEGKLVEAERAYTGVLEEYGCGVLSQKKRMKRNQLVILFRAPGRVDREDLDLIFEEKVDEELKGAIDWQAK